MAGLRRTGYSTLVYRCPFGTKSRRPPPEQIPNDKKTPQQDRKGHKVEECLSWVPSRFYLWGLWVLVVHNWFECVLSGHKRIDRCLRL